MEATRRSERLSGSVYQPLTGLAEVIRARQDGRGLVGAKHTTAYDGLKGPVLVEAVVDISESEVPV